MSLISLYVEDGCNFYSAESLHRACNDEKCILTTGTYTVRDIFAVNSSTLCDRTNLVEIRLPKKVSALYLQDNFLVKYYILHVSQQNFSII
jgi:hypothetical protein